MTAAERSRRWLVWVVVAAVALRAGARLADGEQAFLSNGYTFYLTLAESVLAGDGFCFSAGESCALRMPLYPLLLVPFVAGGVVFPGVVIVQAAMGGLLAWIAWWIGRALFGERAGITAAVLTAFNPYAVLHDTALQDTALLNLLMAGAVALLIRAAHTERPASWLLAGVVLSLAILTSARIALFVPAAFAWAVVATPQRGSSRAKTAVLLALPIAVLAGGWTVRNWRLVGAPVLTTESGEGLYFANSPLTFLHFPERSIDLTAGEIERLPPAAQQALANLEGQDVALDRLYRRWALDYIASDPARTAWGGVRKLWVIASAELSPARDTWTQWGYRAFFLPLHLLAVVGAWQARGRAHSLLVICIAAFAITTAAFWAHTSHKSYLDVVLFVYASAGAWALWPRLWPGIANQAHPA